MGYGEDLEVLLGKRVCNWKYLKNIVIIVLYLASECVEWTFIVFFCPTCMFPSSGNNTPIFFWGSLPFITQSWIVYQSDYYKKDMNGPRNASQIFLPGIWLLKTVTKWLNTIRNLGINLRNSSPLVPAVQIPRSILVMSLHPTSCLPGFLYTNSRHHFCGLQWKNSETFFKK